MLPDEIQDAMAKILLFVFSITLLCMMRTRAAEIPAVKAVSTPIVSLR